MQKMPTDNLKKTNRATAKKTDLVSRSQNRGYKSVMPGLQKIYQEKIIPQLQKEFQIKNRLAVPKIEKVIVNMGIGDTAKNKTGLKKTINTLSQITGQKPSLRQARIAVADFKIRKGDVVGLKVTLRKKRMYFFLEKLFTIILPQVRDFKGVKRNSFDQQANYTLGLKEQTIFPEVDFDKLDKIRGLEISLVISTKDKKKALRLLELSGMPFEKIKN